VRLPIRARLTAWYIGLLVLVIAAMAAFVVTRLQADLTHDIDRSLRSDAAQISGGYRHEGPNEFVDVSRTVLTDRSAGGAQVLDARGRVVLSYGAGFAARPMVEPRARAAALAGRSTLETVTLGEPVRAHAVPTVRGSERQVVVVGESLEGVHESVNRVLLLLVIAAIPALLLTAAGGWWLARKALAPVARMTAQAGRIGIDRLEERVPVPRTTDEIARLAVTLNAMLDRLQQGVEEKRRLVADASHELRTPLAVMRSELDVSLEEEQLPAEARETLESAREEVDRMTRIVENLLTLARVDEGRLELLRRPVALRDVAERALRALQPMADGKRVGLTLEGDGVLAVADRELLQQAVSNLVTNAIKYSDPGGEVRIETWARAGDAGLTVSDTGPGIPAEAQPRVFDRFFRVDAARPRETGGSGLGLAICREIADAHGGRVWVESTEGEGSSFHLSLPGDQSSAPSPTRVAQLGR
jgi:heavy metal sensor kinase